MLIIAFQGDEYSTILSALSCQMMQSFYNIMHDLCPSTMILSVFEHNCNRPNKNQGIGFPIITSVHEVVVMLTDMRHDFLRNWNHIVLIHDHSLGNFGVALFK